MSAISYQDWFGIDHQVEVRINVTNACNLHCDLCDHDAHLPFDRQGDRVFRRQPLVATPEDLERFCEAMAGIGETDAHVLQGGEITVLPVRSIVRMIDVMHAYGRRTGIRTNGYRLASLPVDSLNRLDFIYLNAHGNNEEAIEHCRSFLSQHYGGRTIDEENLFHRDPSQYLHHRQGTIEQGLGCNHLMATLTLQPPIVHPCCNSWALMNALNCGDVGAQLIARGWSTDNPDLRATLAAWRQTLPPAFLETFCADSCYRTAPEMPTRWTRIQRHPLDRVLKP